MPGSGSLECSIEVIGASHLNRSEPRVAPYAYSTPAHLTKPD